MSPARLQSGAIRSFIRGGVQLLPPVSESTGLTPATSAELPAGAPAGPPRVSHPLHVTSDAQARAAPEASGARNRAMAESSARDSRHSHSLDSCSSGRESGPQVQGKQSPSEMSEDSRSQLRQCGLQPRASVSNGPRSLAILEQQVHWPAEPLNGQDEPHVLRSLTTQVDRQLAATDEWGFDTIKLGEVAMHAPITVLTCG